MAIITALLLLLTGQSTSPNPPIQNDSVAQAQGGGIPTTPPGG